MDSYTYAKDTRTDEKYQSDVLNGWKRQKWAAKVVPYKIKLKDEKLLKEGNWSYEPDGEIWINEWKPVEIKVTPYKAKELDIKKHQVDKLTKLGGVILYVTKREYTLIGASYIYRVGVTINADESRVNHESYRVNSSDFKWNRI